MIGHLSLGLTGKCRSLDSLRTLGMTPMVIRAKSRDLHPQAALKRSARFRNHLSEAGEYS
jgi:hypothetical protein